MCVSVIVSAGESNPTVCVPGNVSGPRRRHVHRRAAGRLDDRLQRERRPGRRVLLGRMMGLVDPRREAAARPARADALRDREEQVHADREVGGRDHADRQTLAVAARTGPRRPASRSCRSPATARAPRACAHSPGPHRRSRSRSPRQPPASAVRSTDVARVSAPDDLDAVFGGEDSTSTTHAAVADEQDAKRRRAVIASISAGREEFRVQPRHGGRHIRDR